MLRFRRLAILVFFECALAQWTELEQRQLLDSANLRAKEIERMTKNAAIRQNQLNMAPIPSGGVPLNGPSKPAPPTIDEDRLFLAKMGEQEALANQIIAREAMARQGILAMEATILEALQPLTAPLQRPIPAHFIAVPTVPRWTSDERIVIAARPDRDASPIRINDIVEMASSRRHR
ncbi:unnamed protein product [Caenorhabditis bovis]|uniref:Uncharacterized protein n=1 Tax=Caenorhabditis bovis TaxID=2654633 RepID=A0A8S1FBL4_9PELO|nr:unnamed protein product [Caenorhabditis bovis]